MMYVIFILIEMNNIVITIVSLVHIGIDFC